MVKTKIVEIGSMVPAFEEERLIILFGPKATAELRDYRRSWISGESEF